MARAKKAAVDEMLVGYQFPYDDKKTPYDFIPDKPGEKRKGQTTMPQGFVKVDLTRGVTAVTLPPLAIWRLGKWGTELPPNVAAKFSGVGLSYETWIVSGEGTPSNYEYRLYILPDDVAGYDTPKHPMLWTQAQKKGTKPVWAQTPPASYTGKGGYGAPSTGYATKAKSAPAATLPIGIHFRCTGCGHWWKEAGLAPHTTNCCPGLNGGDSDWAIQCECCDTLDEVSKCKPGFPRPVKLKDVEVVEKEPVTTGVEVVAQ